MVSNPSVVAVVVARAGSRRIPRKGHALIGGEPLVARKLRQLAETPGVSRVVLGSDDESMRPYAEAHGATFVKREARFCDETSTSPDAMVRDMLARPECRAETVLWAHPTNPMVGAEQYAEALAIHKLTRWDVASGYALYGHVWTEAHGVPALKSPCGWAPGKPWPLASTLRPWWVQDGAIFVRPWAAMAEDGLFVGRRGSPWFYEVDRATGWDVNEPWELEVARGMVERDGSDRDWCGG